MVGILIVEPNVLWQNIIKNNLQSRINDVLINICGDYSSADSLIGGNPSIFAGETYDINIINTDIPLESNGEIIFGKGIDLAQRIVDLQKQTPKTIYMTGENNESLGRARAFGFKNLYFRGPREDSGKFGCELDIYRDIREHFERLEQQHVALR